MLQNVSIYMPDISQGSVATRFGCGEIFIGDWKMCYKLTAESNGQSFVMKVDHRLMDFRSEVHSLSKS